MSSVRSKLVGPIAAACVLALGMIAPRAAADTTGVSIRVDLPQGPAYAVYEAVRIRVTLSNHGESPVRVPARSFQTDIILGDRPQFEPEGSSVFPQLIIERPDGTRLATDRTIFALEQAESTAEPIELQPGSSTTWDMLVSIAWDSSSREPIFAHPGAYSISALAFGSGGETRSDAITLDVQIPKGPGAPEAAQCLADLKHEQLWAYYEPELAARWGQSPEMDIPPAIRALAEDTAPMPYRAYAQLAIASAHHGAVQWAIASRQPGRLAHAAADLQAATSLIERVIGAAPALRDRAQSLADQCQETNRRLDELRSRSSPATQGE